MEKQPAYINYFFKGGYVEFADTIRNAFERCGDDIKKSGEQLADAWSDLSTLVNIWYLFVKFITFFNGGDDFDTRDFFYSFWALIKFFFFLNKLIFGAILTSVTAAVMSVIHTVILGIFFLFTYIYFAIVKFIDFLYNHIKKISTSCPQCQKKYALPAYECTCGRKHTDLVPSRYGIMKRRCLCGVKLATTFLNGRHKLPGDWSCPNCGYVLNGDGLQVDITIPVVGGTSSGKSCYINMAINEIKKCAPSLNLNFEYVRNDLLGDDFDDNSNTLKQGYRLDKTHDKKLRYYQFYLTPKKVKVRNLVSLCDVAGELYEDNSNIGKQFGFRYASAFMMIVDPLSIESYKESLGESFDTKAYGASDKPMDEVLSLLVTTLENMFNITSKEMLKSDVVVVINKCDIPGLDEIIGETAVQNYMSEKGVHNRYEAQNAVCEKFFIDYDEQNFLNNLKSKFKSIQFFTCSALGHNEDGSSFTPKGVEEPALWIIDKVSPSIDLKKKWGKQI